ncbi:hypothetical protein HDU98_010460 [Podochytrium sp. JEL0797]|nr:hypothetical protein HDU98_010460 [Podochytrium sp. JEL0797]
MASPPSTTSTHKLLRKWSFSVPRLASLRRGSSHSEDGTPPPQPSERHPAWPASVSSSVSAMRFFMNSLNTPSVDFSTFKRIRRVINIGASPAHYRTQIHKDYLPRLDNLILPGMTAEDAEGLVKFEWLSFPEDHPTSPTTPDSSDATSPAASNDDRVILYIHGGAYCLCSRKTHRGITWKLAKYAKCKLLVVDYRLAPEHVFPLALHDVISAYSFLTNPPPHSNLKKYSPKNITVMGDSAGGGLSLALLLWLRDNGSPLGLDMPAGLGLLSPWLDLSHSMPSFKSNGKYDYLPDKVKDKILHENRNHYYVRDNTFLKNPLVSPLFAEELAATPLPPLLIQIGECERLRDENLSFVTRVFPNSRIQLEMYAAMVHVFQLFNLMYPLADKALLRLGEFAIQVTSPGFTPEQFERSMKRCGNEEGFPMTEMTDEEVEAYLSCPVEGEEVLALSPTSMHLVEKVNQMILEESTMTAEPEEDETDDEKK